MTDRRLGGIGLAAYLVLLVAVLVTGLFSLAYLPWRIGAVTLPVTVLLSAGVLWWAVNAAYRLTGSFWAAAVPAALWPAEILYLGFVPHLGYTLVLTDWRTPALLGVGFLAAATALGSVWGDTVVSRAAATRERAAAAATQPDPAEL